MIKGNSILHVNQPAGRFYNKNIIKGYYNDLSEKVLKSNLAIDKLPKTELANGQKIDFSIAIFQYGLGAYDLYLETNKKEYYSRFFTSVNWAINHQDSNGGWKTFEHECKENPYSSMAQGEGISLLLRAFNVTRDKKYLNAATKAIELMQKPVEKKGCALYDKNNIFLLEFSDKPVVLNGWIFSLFGLYDYILVTQKKNVKSFFNRSIYTLKEALPKFDNGYWSKYDIERKITSPFYHKLHVELLKVLYDLTQVKEFKKYSEKFDEYQKKKFNRLKSFTIKAFQKILER